MIHTFRLAKTVLTITLGVALLLLAGGLIYLNQVGFPGKYGAWLRSELADRGVHLTFETLRYDLKQGIVAENVSFFEEADNLVPLLEAKEVALDLDKTKALRGKFKLRNLRISQGTARIPVDENGQMVTAREINGMLSISESGRASVKDASGLIEGIRVNLSTDLKLSKSKGKDLPPEQQKALRSNHVLSLILDELALWTIPPETPPELTFKISGDMQYPERLSTTFSLKAQNLSRKDYQIDELTLSGDVQSQLVTVDHILIKDASGTASGRADWSVTRREGRFDLSSDLQLQDFLKNCFGVIVLKNLNTGKTPKLSVRGTFAAPPDQAFSVKATGHGNIKDFDFLDSPFLELDSDFSWHDGDLYLRSLKLVHKKGQLNGNMITRGNLARFDVRSTLPLEAFHPFIKPNKGLDQAIKDLTFGDNSTVALDVVGSLNLAELTDWSASGKVHLSNFIYEGTRAHHLACDFNFIPGQAEFANIKFLQNDDRERVRTRFGGPASDEIFADRVHHDIARNMTTISNLRGRIWPTPVTRIFVPGIAKHLEENYRFHRPPHLTLNGTFAGRADEYKKTIFSVALKTEGQTDYPFLGADLPLQNLKADILLRGSGLTVKNLNCATLGGQINGSVYCDLSPGKKTGYKGSIMWDKLSFPLISKAYKFKEEEKGTLTGSIEFNGIEGGVRDFNADGIIAINKGNLVSLPILGPLSPIIAGVLGNKKMGYEQAKDASSTFAIRKGVLQTNDFVAVSTNIILTGEGHIDLLTEKIDMTVRVNARGLLGLLTLPLKMNVLKGIFQFRGTGLYSNPKWRSSPFTRPAKGTSDPLFQKAGKARIVPE